MHKTKRKFSHNEYADTGDDSMRGEYADSRDASIREWICSDIAWIDSPIS